MSPSQYPGILGTQLNDFRELNCIPKNTIVEVYVLNFLYFCEATSRFVMALAIL